MSETIEIRVDGEFKRAAQKKAQAEQVTLSDVVRELLDWWIAGDVDLSDVRPLDLPSVPELDELMQQTQDFRAAVGEFQKRYQDILRAEYGAEQPSHWYD